MNVLEAFVTEVTVIVTTEVTEVVAPVMEKSDEALLVVLDSVKKFTLPPSGLALTSMITPPAGIFEFIFTLSGKEGPGAGASTWPLAKGLVTTTRFSSVSGPPPPPFF